MKIELSARIEKVRTCMFVEAITDVPASEEELFRTLCQDYEEYVAGRWGDAPVSQAVTPYREVLFTCLEQATARAQSVESLLQWETDPWRLDFGYMNSHSDTDM